MIFNTATTLILLFSSAINASPVLSRRAATVPLSSIPLPKEAGPGGLPPLGDNELKHIILGLGTQNYTCADSTANSIPASVGAVADLYLLDPILTSSAQAKILIPLIPPMALQFSKFLPKKGGKPPSPMAKLSLPNNGIAAPKLVYGSHFFNSNGPMFDLFKSVPIEGLSAKKDKGMTAPARSCKGTKSEGAVDWLYLIDNGLGVSYGGVSVVYRLETAGGKAPANCKRNGSGAYTIEVPYAAEYWFAGPVGPA
ncbi:hypothetical protein M501DRAFT_988350 [Patellaria atrata CBS 101060]|uniref:Malate dehydrogenase n=1 Tax=Patellaria atrata CBS 101060 TaxID=1346257 RepID=A0A9P4VU23_9PEZI|nr:hypothetical protein M501DRAFT_988350 [Patellaria atrata CBS 101060]